MNALSAFRADSEDHLDLIKGTLIATLQANVSSLLTNAEKTEGPLMELSYSDGVYGFTKSVSSPLLFS